MCGGGGGGVIASEVIECIRDDYIIGGVFWGQCHLRDDYIQGPNQDFKNACPKQQFQNFCPSRFSY